MVSTVFDGALEGTRTPDLLVRSQSLYPTELPAQNGADDEARTRYLHLGKVALYQMSYVRRFNLFRRTSDDFDSILHVCGNVNTFFKKNLKY